MENYDTLHRCSWCQGDELYQRYHDLEWGVPIKEDHRLFESLILETMQAGLSWITILRKRENYRQALDNFDPYKIALYTNTKRQELLSNPGIIRNKLKINSIISNAQAFINIQEQQGSFSNFLWAYVDHCPIKNTYHSIQQVPANTPLSDRIARDLKKLDFKFVGPTTIYAFMQAVGMVNDHEVNCYRYDQV